jgi:hypothetical protein
VRWLVGLLVVAVGCSAGESELGRQLNEQTTTTVTTAAPTTSEATSTTEATTTTVQTVAPDVRGLLLVRAQDAAGDLRLRPVDVEWLVTGQNRHGRGVIDAANWTVVGQCPAPGELVDDAVTVAVMRPEEALEVSELVRSSGVLDRLACDEARPRG